MQENAKGRKFLKGEKDGGETDQEIEDENMN